MNDKRALCVKNEQEIVGVLLYSRNEKKDEGFVTKSFEYLGYSSCLQYYRYGYSDKNV